MKKTITGIVVAIAIGFALGWLSRGQHEAKPLATPIDIREGPSPDYKLINPYLYSRVDKSIYADEFQGLDSEITSYIQSAEDAKKASAISVYYRDLNNSHWTGIGESDKYEPGSLMKVGVLISYLKESEKYPGVMSDELLYSPDTSGQYYKPASELQSGSHPVSSLIDSMIRDSDNGAMNALVNNDLKGFQNIYTTFGLPQPPFKDISSDYMSPRSYSVLWRTLYNSTYLSRDLSEKALSLLTKTSFTKGIVAGVPANVVVAHKFGEHTNQLPDGTPADRELHDCGIVYYPDRPYLLCVMTRGSDFSGLEQAVSGVSKLVYRYVDTQQKKSI